MRRLRLCSLLLSLTVAAPATAQVTGHPFEISGQAGIFSPDARTRVDTGPAFGGSLGWRWKPMLVLEGYALFAPSQVDMAGEPEAKFNSFGLDLRLNVRSGENKVVPYLLGGMGYARSAITVAPVLERGAPSVGAGVLFNNLFDKPRWAIRAQVRDLFFRDRDAQEFSNNMSAMVGLHYTWGGKYKDQDLDGVRDWLDECPNTPLGAQVDARGCPHDSDGDGVPDGMDKCPATPHGATIDKFGCPADADSDGVADGIDVCPDTPHGATVDVKGCPADADSDGVFDGIDQCPATSRGAKVDERGCPNDSDADGVPDGIDQCPDTSPNLKVDAAGCPIELIEHETELLDTGMMRFNDIEFATNKADLLPASLPTLDLVGQVLSKWPQLKIEIGGHTDQRGTASANQKLSLARAQTVQKYLLDKYPTLQASQYTTRGYGESRPLAPGNDEASWALNRRVEFVVLNKDVLKHEVEKRRLAPKEDAGGH
jgi:outer membrane protein OmpA-like peptidoglycan-associated protein